MSDSKYEAFMGLWPAQVPHWEHWSDPDAETYLTGIDYYEHPRLCRLKMRQLYPELSLKIPDSDTPKVRPAADDTANNKVRWGESQTATFKHGEQYFKTPEDVLAFHPLEHADMRDWPHVVVNFDYSSEESIKRVGCPQGSAASLGKAGTWHRLRIEFLQYHLHVAPADIRLGAVSGMLPRTRIRGYNGGVCRDQPPRFPCAGAAARQLHYLSR